MPKSFIAEFELAGWSTRSVWGYDELIASYFAQLWPDLDSESEAPAVWVSGLVPIATLDDLADALTSATGITKLREILLR